MEEQLRRALTKVQKPGRYTGGEPGIVLKDKAAVDFRFAFCFPDSYEIGMSFLGMKIVYELLNEMEGVWCERAFMPWVDMADLMKAEGLPLHALESKDPLAAFDVLGFTLQYELSYTNILAMLDLAGVPLRAADRDESHPLIMAGGPCCCNAEPVAPFFDVMLLGEAEEQLPVVCRFLQKAKRDGLSRRDTLLQLAGFEGVYLPSLYDISYSEDGTVASLEVPAGVPERVRKAVLRDFDAVSPPKNLVVPMIGAVHDRVQLEVLRGCVRGCRFCQAGFIYRPMRERPVEALDSAARGLCDATGYEEISLTSLSTSDHSELEPLLDSLLGWTKERKINLSLPSLRVDNFTQSLVEKTTKVRKSGLTFAPEAGTQRLRDVINKNVTDEEIDRTCTLAFDAGYNSVKLYFMMGLPTETLEDIEGIAKTAQRVVDLYYSNPNKRKGQGVKVSVSVSNFVPKPMTPFQYCGQETPERLKEKQGHLLRCLSSKKISISYSDSRISFLEAVFARGDRRLADVIERAYQNGCRFDGWDDQFLNDEWLKAFAHFGIDPADYAGRTFEPGDRMPWSHLDYGVTEEYLAGEYRKATEAAVTPPCNKSCSGCGVNHMMGRACFANG